MNDVPPVQPAEGAPDDTLVERLRAADPAARAHPDVATLRVAVDERIAAGRTDQLAAARARRWTSWPARVAGVAAAALLVGGGGGYAVGLASDGGTTAPAEQPVALSGPAAAQGMAGAESAGSSMTADASSRSMAPSGGYGGGYGGGYWGGHTVFTSTGLSTDGGTAAAWGFDPAAAFSLDRVVALAGALGITAEPVRQDGYWQVGPNDGTGPSLTVSPDGVASFSFYDPTKDPYYCPSPAPEQVDPAASDPALSDPATSGLAPQECVERDLGPAPQGDDAVNRTAELMRGVGADPAAYELVAENWGDTVWTYVTAYQVVDGKRSGMQWSAAFTGEGVSSFSGMLAPVVALGEYDVISPADAVARLTDPRFGAGFGGPILYAEGDEATMGGSEGAMPEPTVPPSPAPGAAISWPVNEVTIVSARLGLAAQYLATGATVLVPSYELTDSDGGVWGVVAVADAELDFSPVSGR